MEPIRPAPQRPQPIHSPGNLQGSPLQGRRVTWSKYDPPVQLFLKQFSGFLYTQESKAEFTATASDKDFRTFDQAILSQKAQHIRSLLERFNRAIPIEKDFAQDMLQAYFESETPEQFIANTQALQNIPKEEALDVLLARFKEIHPLLDELKSEYQTFQRNFQGALKGAIVLNEEFLKVYMHEGPGYNAKEGTVLLSQNQLEFAKSLAKKYFPQILEMNWNPHLEKQIAVLIQAIVVGDAVLDENKKHFLPASPACFILKETFGKEFGGEPKMINNGISFSYNHLMNFDNRGEDKDVQVGKPVEPEEQKRLLKFAEKQFLHDIIERTGFHLSIGNDDIAIGTPLDNRGKIGETLANHLLESIKKNPQELKQLVAQAKQSPLLSMLKAIYPDAFKTERHWHSIQEWFPRAAFDKILLEEVHDLVKVKDKTKHHLEMEAELKDFLSQTKADSATLARCGLRVDDLAEETQMLADLQGILQLKFLEMLIVINQSQFAPMITPLTVQLYSEETPFFPNPADKQFSLSPNLDNFSARLTCNIATTQEAINDRFKDKPIVGSLTITTAVPSLMTVEHNQRNQPRTNIIGNLRVGWNAPKAVVDQLVTRVLPDYKPPEVPNAQNILVKELFPQLDKLAKLQPGDDIWFDANGVTVGKNTMNKIRPVANTILYYLPTRVSGAVTFYTRFSQETQYNPKAPAELEAFTDKLDKTIKKYVEQAIAEGKSYNEINKFIMEEVSTRVFQAHRGLVDWGQANDLINPGGKFFRIAHEVGSVYLVPTKIEEQKS